MLQCRECGQLLIRTRDLAVSVCPKCRLRVLPVAALEATLTPDAARAFRERVALDDGQPGASCPSCRGTMRALDVAFDGLVVELDVCRHCQLVLLDPGEIDQLPRRPPPPPMDAAVAKREMAKARVEIERQRPRWLYSDDYELTWQQWIPALLRLPVDVDAPFTATPRATWGVAAALVVAFLIELTNQREFITQLGWIPAHPFRWLGLTSLTSFFVHAGWLHLLGNLYFLLAFGPGVESRLGVRRFLVLLAIATLVGDVTHALFEPRKELPTIGASGGISALIVFYAVSFPWNRFVVLLGGRWIFWQLSVPAVFYLFCWIGWQLFLLLLQLSGESVSALAHLGGFATGLVAFFVWRRRER